KNSLVNQARLVESQISQQNLQKEDVDYLYNLARDLGSKINCRITIVNTQGKVLADSQETRQAVLKMDNHAGRPEVKTALGGGVGEKIRYSNTLKIDMLYVAVPIESKGMILGVVRMAIPLTSVEKTLSDIRKTVLTALLFALCLAFVLGSVLAAASVRSIKKIIRACRKFSAGDFSYRIFEDSDDEIGELAKTLNKMSQDIEDKISEIKLQNQKLGAVFNSMIEGVIVLDKDNRIVSVNSTIESIFSVSKEQSQGKFFLEAIPNNDIYEIINRVLGKAEYISQEISLVWPVRRIFQVNACPIFEKDKVNGCLLVIHDITEIRKLESMRRDFVANVSHELRTPLTSIKGFIETLLEGALEDKENSRQFLNIIKEHSERLNSLINDLLELSHIESGEMKLEIEDLKLKEIFDKVLSGFKAKLNKKKIEVENNLSPGLLVRIDKDKIEQVATNLIDNAVKFNQEKGSIKIYSQDFNNEVKIIVEDSGIGIPPKDLPRIFERFYRVDKARSRELGGTGLGLSIVKHIVELHGGSVGVESTEGLGSKFWFTLSK
ncbi:MAG: ATP-binding protein, partial [Candidatus Omnitrophica bacterium]|nr:ATP-binding protein [Candidatus Omnitrophota bacterium]